MPTIITPDMAREEFLGVFPGEYDKADLFIQTLGSLLSGESSHDFFPKQLGELFAVYSPAIISDIQIKALCHQYNGSTTVI